MSMIQKRDLMSQTNSLGKNLLFVHGYGNKVTMTDPNGKVTTFNYDKRVLEFINLQDHKPRNGWNDFK